MFQAATYTERRARLAETVDTGLILLPANGDIGMNCEGNTYPFRQDSTFRYFAGHNRPNLVLTIDADTGESKLYGEDRSLDDVIWMGETTPVAELAERIGASYGGDLEKMQSVVGRAEVIHHLPCYREQRRHYLCQWIGEGTEASEQLIRAVVAQRSVKTAEEIAEMERAVQTSLRMHAAAREAARPGMKEAEVAGLVEGMAIQAGGRLAYPAIVTRDGHILHNHHHDNVLRKGDLLLIDAGAETDTGYAGDLTRTFSVGTELDERQRAVYDIVDRAKREAIAGIRPGVPFRELHDLSARILTEGLRELGLMRGDIGESVAAGAHALFFPHGLGHMIGLDVHDMEDLGEDFVGYDEEIKRSERFGTRNLRLGRRLREGFAVTVEPGIYFIPVLIDRWRQEGKHTEFIDYAALEGWRNFGGIRLEDNVVVTSGNSRVLGGV
jgi:Xaa-Pro aminopeptidase